MYKYFFFQLVMTLGGFKLSLDMVTESVQFSSVAQSCPTLCDSAARQASLSITNSRSPLKPMSIELVMSSNHLILCGPLLLLPSIFPSIRVSSPPSSPRMMGSFPLCITSTWLVKSWAEKDCHDESVMPARDAGRDVMSGIFFSTRRKGSGFNLLTSIFTQ